MYSRKREFKLCTIVKYLGQQQQKVYFLESFDNGVIDLYM